MTAFFGNFPNRFSASIAGMNSILAMSEASSNMLLVRISFENEGGYIIKKALGFEVSA